MREREREKRVREEEEMRGDERVVERGGRETVEGESLMVVFPGLGLCTRRLS